MDFSNISELISTISKNINNSQSSNIANPITSTEEQNTLQQQSNKLYSNSFPEPLNISQNNVLDNKIHTQNKVDNNQQTFNNALNFKEQIQQQNNSNFSNPLSELIKFLNPDTIKLIQQFLPMLNNFKGTNLLSSFTNLIQGNKKNNINPINVVSNKNEINDIEALIRIDSN